MAGESLIVGEVTDRMIWNAGLRRVEEMCERQFRAEGVQ